MGSMKNGPKRTINVATISSFTTARDGATEISFTNSGVVIVVEDYAAVRALVGA
jgi:hypothetical protein